MSTRAMLSLASLACLLGWLSPATPRHPVAAGATAQPALTPVATAARSATAVPTATAARQPTPAPTATAVVAPAPLLLIGPGGGEGPLLSLIATARRRVLVEAFALADAPVVAALQGAERRGVDVRVMLDPLGLNSATTLALLQAAGIRTRAPNPAYAVTHLNAVVVDAGAVAISSAALTAYALGPYGPGYVVIDRDRLDVVQAASLFYDDWLRRPVTSFSHNLVLLPDNADRLAGLIDTAGLRLELYTSYLSDPGVVASLRSARLRGVVVRVLTPPGSNNASLLPLAPQGRVRFRDVGAGTVLVIDRRTVFVGSMDLAGGTLSGHRELGVAISGQPVALLADRVFFGAYTAAPVLRLAPPPRPRPVRRRTPAPVGVLRVAVSVSPVVRSGGTGFIVVSTVPGARVTIAITYPAGSTPAAGTTGASGVADRKNGIFAYRWTMAGHLHLGMAQVSVRVRGLGAVATAATSFNVVR